MAITIVDLHVIYINIMSNSKMETDMTPGYDTYSKLYRMSNNDHITLYMYLRII